MAMKGYQQLTISSNVMHVPNHCMRLVRMPDLVQLLLNSSLIRCLAAFLSVPWFFQYLHCRVIEHNILSNAREWDLMMVFFCDTSCLLNKRRLIIFVQCSEGLPCSFWGNIREKEKHIDTCNEWGRCLCAFQLWFIRSCQWQRISERNWEATSLNVSANL